MSLPDDWSVYVEELTKHSKDGRDATAGAINELISAGYVRRSKKRDDSNKFAGQIQLKRKDEAPAHEAPVEEGPDYIFVKADKKLIKVNFPEIIYIEGLKDYVIIRLDNSRVITLQTMKSLEDKLPTDKFKRIHRSYIVNIDKIDAVVGNMIEVSEKGQLKHLPVGKNYRDELLDMINQNRL